MKEIVNPAVTERPVAMETFSTEDFIRETSGEWARVHYLSTRTYRLPNHREDLPKALLHKPELDEEYQKKFVRPPVAGVSRLAMAVHHAFNLHVPLGLRPEVVWTVVAQEIARYVKDHATESAVAALFTRDATARPKLEVDIPEYTYDGPNPWLEDVVRFRPLLEAQLPSSILTAMTPPLSTATPLTTVAHLVSFMDAASRYYRYGMATLCGIPKFRVHGTVDDWRQLGASAARLAEYLPPLAPYFNAVQGVVEKIAFEIDASTPDLRWWSSLYKIDEGSGGPYSNGWLNHLYAHVYNKEGATLKSSAAYTRASGHIKLNNYPANLSRVPFEWNYYGRKIPMAFVAGVLDVAWTDGYLTPSLGVGVIEESSST
jgi:hypothetical protein